MLKSNWWCADDQATAQVGDRALERQILARAEDLGVDPSVETNEDVADQAVRAVEDYRRKQQALDRAEDNHGAAPAVS